MSKYPSNINKAKYMLKTTGEMKREIEHGHLAIDKRTEQGLRAYVNKMTKISNGIYNWSLNHPY